MPKPVALSYRAYQSLRQRILAGEVQPGEALFELHLAPQLGMSRTPVREALQSLARDGYLEELPGRGFAVPRRSLDDLRQFFELREVLEAAATRFAALRATGAEVAALQALCDRYALEPELDTWNQIGAQFHAAIIDAARNARLATLLASLHDQIDLSRRSVIYAGPVWRETAVRDHQLICNAIAARDEVAAQQAATEHVRRSYQATLRAHQPEAFSVQRLA
jgi:DNA-binding GntR family transcriptional regulator